MIRENEIFKIGKLIKPHGLKGEISFAFENDIFDRVDNPYLVCLIDGIYIPFYIEEYRFKGEETALMKFEGLDSKEQVQQLSNVEVYFPRKYFEQPDTENLEYSWNYFIGFTIIDLHAGEVGLIDDIDDSTMNILFVVTSKSGDEILIPVSEDFILEVDSVNKILKMDLPEGLLE